MTRTIILCSSLFFVTSLSWAQRSVPTDSVYDKEQALSEVTVTSKSKSQMIQQQAYAVSVVDLKGLRANNPSFSRVLNTVSSVRIRENGGMGSDYTFAMNGFSGNQVRFFLDGIPMDNFGTSFNLATISASMADRVEVYKGVLPVYLGADALGGAVNIVSRVNANYLDASYSVGSFNTHKVNVNGAYTDPRTGFTFRANAFFNFSDNDYKVWAPIVDLSTNEVSGNQWVHRFNDGYRAGGIKFETGLTARSWADYLLLGAIVSGNDKDVQTGATMDAVYGGVRQKSYSIIPSLRYRKTNLWVDGLTLSLYGTYNIVKTHNTDTLGVRYNWLGQQVPDATRGEGYLTNVRIDERQWQGNLSANYMIDAHQSVALNHVITSMRRSDNDDQYPDRQLNGIAQYLTKNITALGYQVSFSRWNASVFGKYYNLRSTTQRRFDEFTDNARWEKVKERSGKLGYGATATYFIMPWLQAKVSYEQAYRMPEPIEMFGDGFIQKANLDLRPEQSRNLNVGLVADVHLDDHALRAEANYIYRRAKDFIQKGVSLTSDPTTSYDNLGKVITKGIEGNIRYAFRNLFHVSGSITYQDIKDRQRFEQSENTYVGDGITENISYGHRVPNIPYFFFSGEAGYNLHNVFGRGNTLSATYSTDYTYRYYLSFPGLGRAASKKVIPEQFAHNLALTYALQGGRYEVGVECTNLTDKKLYDNYRLQKPGRAFNVKFRYFISK